MFNTYIANLSFETSQPTDPPETWRPPGARAPWKRDNLGGEVPAWCNESSYINGMIINPFSPRLNALQNHGLVSGLTNIGDHLGGVE